MKSFNTQVTCIACPMGCIVDVEIDENKNIVSINNARCKKGMEYVRQEVTNPVRTLTTTVRIKSRDQEHPLLPVQTQYPIPKKLLKKAMQDLAGVEVSPPISCGDVVVHNLLDTGIDVISNYEVLE